MRRTTAVIALAAVLALPNTAAAQQVRRTVHGDTTIVETVGNGVWGPPKQAVLRLRVGDDANTSPFDEPACFAALPNGGVAVYDAGLPAVLVFDSTGKLIRQMGREGSGPGEVGAGMWTPGCLAAAVDGTVLLLDLRNHRVDRWSNDGRVLSAINPGPYVVGDPDQNLYAGPDSSIFVARRDRPSRRRCGTDASGLSFVAISPPGRTVDSIPVQHSWLHPASLQDFAPDELSFPLRDGRILVAGTDRLAFLVTTWPAGRVLMVSHPIPPVPVAAEERAEHLAIQHWSFDPLHGACPIPGVAAVKAAFSGAQQDVDGRIWLERHVAAVPGKPAPFVFTRAGTAPSPTIRFREDADWMAFRENGVYLGEVAFPFPRDLIGIRFAGRTAWGLLNSEDGSRELVRFTIPGISGR
jgi:hypothetical protein